MNDDKHFSGAKRVFSLFTAPLVIGISYSGSTSVSKTESVCSIQAIPAKGTDSNAKIRP